MKMLCLGDLFFLLTVICKRKDADDDWIYDRCREVEENPDGYLDLWAREHYKSTIITFALTIQDILKDPEVTFGFFSHTRPIAKGFLDQIKREFENNDMLKDLFPEILYQNPESEAPKWSLDGGIVVKRKTNPKESTIEAWGLVDGQPTSKHFRTLIYDDVVTLESVSTPDQIKKVTAALEMSYNLGSQGGRRRFIGTRYHVHDTYSEIMKRGTVTPRIKPATKNGEWPGQSVFMPQNLLEEKRRDYGPYTFGTQMLQNPVADKSMSFKEEWLKYYKKLGDYSKWNLYILVDPASKKKTTSDYTVIAVVGLAPDGNYYLIDAVRDRLNLTQRTEKLFEFHRKYKPKAVGYEEYGLQADIEHIQYVMEQENYRFKIVTLGGVVKKEDRIKRLVPIFEQHRFWLPETLHFVDYEKKRIDFIEKFITDEYRAFPVTNHDDMLDCISRIVDPEFPTKFPEVKKIVDTQYQSIDGGSGYGWMA